MFDYYGLSKVDLRILVLNHVRFEFYTLVGTDVLTYTLKLVEIIVKFMS